VNFESLQQSQHSCSVGAIFLVEEDTNQGSNPGGSKKSPSLATRKSSGRALAFGTCGWSGPSEQGLVAVVAVMNGEKGEELRMCIYIY